MLTLVALLWSNEWLDIFKAQYVTILGSIPLVQIGNSANSNLNERIQLCSSRLLIGSSVKGFDEPLYLVKEGFIPVPFICPHGAGAVDAGPHGQEVFNNVLFRLIESANTVNFTNKLTVRVLQIIVDVLQVTHHVATGQLNRLESVDKPIDRQFVESGYFRQGVTSFSVSF